MKTADMVIPMGFKLEEEKLILTPELAQSVMLMRICTTARRVGGNIELVRHFVTCPHCGGRVYVYNKEIDGYTGRIVAENDSLTDEQIQAWLSHQITLFDLNQESLELYTVYPPDFDLTCPMCKNTIENNSDTREVRLHSRRHKVFVRVKVQDLREFFTLTCVDNGEISYELPAYEVACFNFRNGHTYLSLENEQGKRYAVRDVTFDKKAWTQGAVINALNHSHTLRNAVKDMFEAQWGAELPYKACELDADVLRTLTMFTGYNRYFYSAIPYLKNSLVIEESFRLQARKLHNARRVEERILKKSSLPCVKSVRKAIFENPGLLFYQQELEVVWALLKDPNFFVKFLKEEEIYKVLSGLHTRPLMFSFFYDLACVADGNSVLTALTLCWFRASEYAMGYVCMTDKAKKKEQLRWRKKKRDRSYGWKTSFAIPLCKPKEFIRNCTIDGYQFVWLTTSAEYQHAGESLRNCLTDWTDMNYPVVCIKKHGQIMGAIEIRNYSVYQALTYDNEPIEDNTGLGAAYKKWFEKYNLSTCDMSDLDMGFDDDDMPF